MIVLPYLQFRSDSLIRYSLVDRDFSHQRLFQSRLTQNLLETPKYTGLLTPGAKKRLTKCIELLVQAAEPQFIPNKKEKFKLSFTTLTIYSTDRNITASEAHETCLEPLLRWMRDRKPGFMYVWKAELQKRGQIHYHITSNAYIPYKELRQKWNALQKKAGYLDSYFKKFNRWNPASTEIMRVKKEESLSGYLIKEFVKNYQNNKSVGGKVWDCSMNLKQSKYFTDFYTSDYQNAIYNGIANGSIKEVQTEHCTIFKMLKYSTKDLLNECASERAKFEYNSIMEAIRNKNLITDATIKEKKPDIFAPLNTDNGSKINFKVQLTMFSDS